MLRESLNTFQEIITLTVIGTYSIKTHIFAEKKITVSIRCITLRNVRP